MALGCFRFIGHHLCLPNIIVTSTSSVCVQAAFRIGAQRAFNVKPSLSRSSVAMVIQVLIFGQVTGVDQRAELVFCALFYRSQSSWLVSLRESAFFSFFEGFNQELRGRMWKVSGGCKQLLPLRTAFLPFILLFECKQPLKCPSCSRSPLYAHTTNL